MDVWKFRHRQGLDVGGVKYNFARRAAV